MKRKTIKVLTSLIPHSTTRKNLRDKLLKKSTQEVLSKYKIAQHNSSLSKKLELIKNKKKVRVVFFVIFDAVFPAKSLFEKMQKDIFFDPFIVVIPDSARGKKNMFYNLDKTYKTLIGEYKNVYSSYDYKTEAFIDFSNSVDFVCSANPYDNMTQNFYRQSYFIDKNILSFHVNYAYMGRTKYEKTVVNLNFYYLQWKVFLESEKTLEEIKNMQKIKSTNLSVSGYCKMDDLQNITVKKTSRVKIIIAPHHTITESKNGLNISQFLTYSDFFLEMPTIYKEVDFIFRPHPLLFVNLAKENLWGKEKTDKYFKKLISFPNVTYSDGGEYFDLFINSDALIHDCGSFLAEYFYTNNPQCYILKHEESISKEFLDFGQEMLSHTYRAFSKKDIISFIDNVVIKKEDIMKKSRDEFAAKEIKINYPNASDFIIKQIKNDFEHKGD